MIRKIDAISLTIFNKLANEMAKDGITIDYLLKDSDQHVAIITSPVESDTVKAKTFTRMLSKVFKTLDRGYGNANI